MPFKYRRGCQIIKKQKDSLRYKAINTELALYCNEFETPKE